MTILEPMYLEHRLVDLLLLLSKDLEDITGQL